MGIQLRVSSEVPPPPSPPLKSKALSIILQNYIDEVTNGNSAVRHIYRVSILGHSDKDAVSKVKPTEDPSMIDNLPWPGGSFLLNFDEADCEYKSGRANSGRFVAMDRIRRLRTSKMKT
ncbi:hypothetical protein CC78DRAFT_592378 [Lojkania enalia]|uniref:Uncharacterized protein n=1 Tax=Lojkania enalia TaxID=147567 RepID=A0A9P4K387_9PLEO|nr:hypothetical protein CC78DRAFT_592378 [Didymosphaeria enalia]